MTRAVQGGWLVPADLMEKLIRQIAECPPRLLSDYAFVPHLPDCPDCHCARHCHCFPDE